MRVKRRLEFVLGGFRASQNLAGAKKIQQAELLDPGTNENVRGADA